MPVYDSSVVFTNALTGALLFGTGVLVGSAWNNRLLQSRWHVLGFIGASSDTFSAPQTRAYSLTDLEYCLCGCLLPCVSRLRRLCEHASTKLAAAGPSWSTAADVIQMLADHLDWTESLGMASALQPEDVATAIQMLRAQAEKVGNLKSTAEQVVTSRDEGGELP
ncbi:MAG: DUF3300 domain-containing protein [Pseudolabrys sp.]